MGCRESGSWPEPGFRDMGVKKGSKPPSTIEFWANFRVPNHTSGTRTNNRVLIFQPKRAVCRREAHRLRVYKPRTMLLQLRHHAGDAPLLLQAVGCPLVIGLH